MAGNTVLAWDLKPFADRERLINELHARPFAEVSAPVRLSHIVMLGNEHVPEGHRAAVAQLCRRLGAAPPGEDATHHMADLGNFRLKWERHTEFSSLTFFRDGPFDDPFASPAISDVPGDWLAALPGELLVAIHLAVLAKDRTAPDDAVLVSAFGSDRYVGSEVAGGSAKVWTDMRLHGDGFGRVMVHDSGLGGQAIGRLVQRLLEIETYRLAALLALPLALELRSDLRGLEERATELTTSMNDLATVDEERAVLAELTQLNAKAAELGARSTYRFAASEAYYGIVRSRLAELRESRIGNIPTITQFMDRRLAPAMATCAAVGRRLTSLTGRLQHASSLLRTTVDVAMEAQNRDLLASMNRRVQLQLRLQQTVEGLSVVAISYYSVGLIGYVAKPAASMIGIDPSIMTALSVPLVLLVAWLGLRRIRRVAHDLSSAQTD